MLRQVSGGLEPTEYSGRAKDARPSTSQLGAGGGGQAYSQTLSVVTYGQEAKTAIRASSNHNALEVQGADGVPALRVFHDGLLQAGAEALRVYPDEAVTVGPHLTESASSTTMYLGDDRNHSIRAPWGQGLRFGTNGVDNAMLIEDVSGNVQVASTLSACKLVVEVLEGCDFVFDPEYHLPSLSDRKEQILLTRHLSGVSGANEMEREAMSLSETTLGILRNVEEHDLYLSQHDAKLSELQKLIERQQHVIDEQLRMLTVLHEQMEELNRKLSK